MPDALWTALTVLAWIAAVAVAASVVAGLIAAASILNQARRDRRRP